MEHALTPASQLRSPERSSPSLALESALNKLTSPRSSCHQEQHGSSHSVEARASTARSLTLTQPLPSSYTSTQQRAALNQEGGSSGGGNRAGSLLAGQSVQPYFLGAQPPSQFHFAPHPQPCTSPSQQGEQNEQQQQQREQQQHVNGLDTAQWQQQQQQQQQQQREQQQQVNGQDTAVITAPAAAPSESTEKGKRTPSSESTAAGVIVSAAPHRSTHPTAASTAAAKSATSVIVPPVQSTGAASTGAAAEATAESVKARVAAEAAQRAAAAAARAKARVTEARAAAAARAALDKDDSEDDNASSVGGSAVQVDTVGVHKALGGSVRGAAKSSSGDADAGRRAGLQGVEAAGRERGAAARAAAAAKAALSLSDSENESGSSSVGGGNPGRKSAVAEVRCHAFCCPLMLFLACDVPSDSQANRTLCCSTAAMEGCTFFLCCRPRCLIGSFS